MKDKSARLICTLLVLTSIAIMVCGCGGHTSFNVSNLVVNPANVESGDIVTISALVTNTGSEDGIKIIEFTVAGIEIGSQSVELAGGASQTVNFTYTPTASGNFTVAIDDLSGSLVVNEAARYWEIRYKAVEGSYIVMEYSPAQVTPIYKKIYFNESDGIRLTMMINKSSVDGARDVIIPAVDWIFPSFEVESLITGVDMDLAMTVDEDGVGMLYVEDGAGDVDMSSVSTAGQSPIQVDVQGDGNPDPAGSMVIALELTGDFETSIGQRGTLPFDVIFTTGHTDNVIHTTTNKKMDGASIESDGLPFAKDGGVADYVGTSGTITTTGSGGCLGIKLVGVSIDMHTEIKLVLEPVD